MARKRMLYKSKVEYMSGQGVYAMNHVLGCSHGCLYPCYAFMAAKRFGQVADYDQWCKPVIVENALELLERDLEAPRKEPVERVHLCFTTDPFMYEQDEICELTLRCIELINSYGIPVTTLTKGVYPLDRDPEAMILKGHPENEYGVTFNTVSDGFRKAWEPHAAPWDERVAVCFALHFAGVRTWASLEPFPAMKNTGIIERYGYENEIMDDESGSLHARVRYTDHPMGALASVLEVLPNTVDRVVFGRWNYNPEMPTDFDDVDAWYAQAAERVKAWGELFDIETIIKKGTE